MGKNMREYIQQGRNFLPDNQIFWTYNSYSTKKKKNFPEGNK